MSLLRDTAQRFFDPCEIGKGWEACQQYCVETDYVYVMQFDGEKIRHMTKIWNDRFGLQQLGWV